ncbi:hypothetical protein B6228_03725 [Candidatus Atribacteria bacterium 4572_76]|nr:MAG: hypothetical protein B6228_03725 [Candidatus Atribacteria bacterium 4572_76]
MRIINLKKRAIIILLIIVIILVVSGCARWPNGPGPGPGTEYQLQITVQVLGEINVNDGIYYIVLDNNGNSADGPGGEVDDWEDEYYYVQLDDWGFDFAQVEEGSSSIALTNSSISDDELQVTISLSDLGEIEDSIDFNVVTTDLDNNTYDYLDSYLTIGTTFGSMAEDYDSPGDSENDEDDFDIIGVIAEIITL